MTAAKWLGPVLLASIILTVLGLGLTATWQDAMYLLQRPKLLRAVLSMNIVMPHVFGLVVATIVSVPYQKWRARAARTAPHIEAVGRGSA